jgi:hypothetical protein
VPRTSPRAARISAAALAIGCAALAVASASPGLAAGRAATTNPVRSLEWWLRELSVTKTWRRTTGAGVTVAVLDSGVDASQADLGGSVDAGPDYTNSGRNPGSPYYAVHGTEVASIIAAHGHGPGNADGMLGAAPAAKILSVRVTLDPDDPLLASQSVVAALPAAVAKGIRYAVGAGAQVIDLPLDPAQVSAVSFPQPVPSGQPPPPPPIGGSPAEARAVAYALRQGVILVAPAGDNGAGNGVVNYPAAYPGVISVGAFDNTFTKAPYSSRQPYVTLTAAGSGVIAALPDGTYQPMYSTSAASAVVAGIAALIKSAYPGLSPAQVREALIRSTVFRPAGGLADGSGYGTVNAARALRAAAAIAMPKTAAPSAVAPVSIPNRLPAPPRVTGGALDLRPTLERDGFISGAVLVVLLAAIAVFALRQRRLLRAAARRAEARAAPAAPDPFAAGLPPAMAGVGGGQAGQLPPFLPAPAPPRPLRPGEPRPGFAGSPFAAASRAPRQVKVSGSPPWEPAPKPEGQLPWASDLGTARTGARAGAPASGGSLWDAASSGRGAAEPADRGGAGQQYRARTPQAAEETETAEPGEPSTEVFPAFPME